MRCDAQIWFVFLTSPLWYIRMYVDYEYDKYYDMPRFSWYISILPDVIFQPNIPTAVLPPTDQYLEIIDIYLNKASAQCLGP